MGGGFVDRYPGHRVLSLSLLGICVSSIVTPLPEQFWLLCCIFAVTGYSAGLMDASLNTCLVWLWPPEELSTYMQTMHFFFGLGAVISPLITSQVLTLAHDDIAPTFYIQVGVARVPLCVSAATHAHYWLVWSERAKTGDKKQTCVLPCDCARLRGAGRAGSATGPVAARTTVASESRPVGGPGAEGGGGDHPRSRQVCAWRLFVLRDREEGERLSGAIVLSVCMRPRSRRANVVVVAVSAFLFTCVGAEVGTGGWMSTFAIRRCAVACNVQWRERAYPHLVRVLCFVTGSPWMR